LLSAVPGLVLPAEPAWARSNWQSYCVRLPQHCDQVTVMQQLLDAGISARRGVMCAHREPAYRQQPWSCGPGGCSCEQAAAQGSCDRLRASERATDECVILPLFHQMTRAEQDTVVAALRAACSTKQQSSKATRAS
jgi:dTDP-4-amino-4,6-dideoxygalactose transaminase